MLPLISKLQPRFDMLQKFRFLPIFLVCVSHFQTSDAVPLILEDYTNEDGSSGVPGSFSGPYGGGGAIFDESPPGRPEGNKALRFELYHSADSGDWGIVHIKNFDQNTNNAIDISDYQELEFSFYSEGNDSIRSISVQLHFTPGTTPYPDEDGIPFNLRGKAPVENVWSIKEKPFLSEAFEEWRTINVILSDTYFGRETIYNASNLFDLANLEKISVVVLNNTGADPAADQPVYVDDIRVNSLSPNLHLDKTTVSFGSLIPRPDDYRFESESLSVDYFASTSTPWEIRIYTSNDNDLSGLVNGSYNIPLKLDVGAEGDASNELDWSGGEATDPKFLFVLDDNTEDAFGDPFFTKIASSANEDSPSGNIEFNFAIDASGAAVGTYSTDIFVELYIYD
jgi:hypothetical protein